MLENMTQSTFAENMNSTFRLYTAPDQAMPVELVELSEGRSSPQQTVFSVVFRGSPDTVLSQGMYRMEHDKLDPFDLFLVPIRRDKEGTYYEAVFNRLTQG